MPLPPGEIRWTVWFAGRVQGVGFRYSARRVAERFAVRGYVRNLPDGRVELVAEGAETELAALLAAIEAEMPGHIRDRQIQPSPVTGEFPDFRVRF